MQIRIEEISADNAQAFWSSASIATTFVNPELLSHLPFQTTYIGAYKGEELYCVWPQYKGMFGHPPPFFYYFGPYFKVSDGSAPPYRQYATSQKLFNALIDKVLSADFKNFTFELSPEHLDTRAFQWWNYHDPSGKRFSISPRYTARVVNLSAHKDNLSAIYRSDDKRKKIRKLLKEKSFFFKVNSCTNFDYLIQLYRETILRSGGSISEVTTKHLKVILETTQAQNQTYQSYLIEAYSSSGVFAGYQLLIGSKQVINAVAQCVVSDFRNQHVNIFLTYSSMTYALENNYHTFDFNGANSPTRADDKHAYGASLSVYFNIEI